MKIEIIAISLADAQMAEQAGANRIELVSGIAEGGLTPSYGLIEQVINKISIPVNVMIRPHSQSFQYKEEDMQVVLKDIEVCKQLGVKGIVFGSLNEHHEINESQLQAVIQVADGMDITFHRAFDEVADQHQALNTLMRYPQISRVLTSAGANKVWEAKESLQALVAYKMLNREAKISIMPGSGLNALVLEEFVQNLAVTELHFGSGVRIGNSFAHEIDPKQITLIQQIVQEEKSKKVNVNDK